MQQRTEGGANNEYGEGIMREQSTGENTGENTADTNPG